MPNLFFPRGAQVRGATTALQRISQGVVQWPRVIKLESLDFQIWLVTFGQHKNVGLDFVQFGARMVPKIRRYVFRNVAAKPVRVEFANPILEHFRHVFAQFRIRIIEFRHIEPVMWISNLPGRVMFVKVRPLHHHAVP